MNKYYLFIIFSLLVFIVPIHFFIIGDNYGYGIQGFFYRYQEAPQGVSFIPLTNEIGYVTSGLIDGKSGLSILSWAFGSLLFYSSFFIFLYKFHELNKSHYKYISYLIFISIGSLLISSFLQYGLFFVGPAGISILIGIPFLFFFGWVLYQESTGQKS